MTNVLLYVRKNYLRLHLDLNSDSKKLLIYNFEII